MIDLKTLTALQLQNSDFSDTVFAEGNQLVLFPNYQSTRLAKALVTLLRLDTKTVFTKSEKKYQSLVIRLQFASLDRYSEKEIISLFERHIWDALGTEDYFIWDRVKSKLIELHITERDIFKEQLTNALFRNAQKISSSITIGDRTFPGILGNWIKQYIDAVGIEALDQIKQAKYFSDDKLFRALPKATKEKLQELFKIYGKLQLSSFSPQGYEETVTMIDKDGNYFDLQDGTMVPIFTDKKVVEGVQSSLSTKVRSTDDGMQLLQKHFQKYRADRKKILEAEDKLMMTTKGDVTEVKRTLAAASRSQDRVTLIAALKVLARQGALVGSLQTSPAWLDATKEYVKEKYKNRVSQSDLEAAVSNMKLEPESPVVQAEFYQYLLRKKVGMSENNSALVGVELGQLLGGQYQDIAYGNEAGGNFVWSRNIIKNQKLVRD